MNILFLSSVFPDSADPSRGTYNLSTCLALAEHHAVRVIAPRGWPEVLSTRLRNQQIAPCTAAVSAGIGVEHPTYWYSPKVLRERYGEFLWWSVRAAVDRLSLTFPPDAVLSYWAHPDGDAAIRAARSFGVPVGIITGGSDVLLLPKSPARGRCVRRVLNQADVVLTVSDGVRQSVINAGIDGRQVRTVYQGVDEAQFSPGDRTANRQRLARQYEVLHSARPLLVWVGRMVALKRIDVLLDAVARMRLQRRDPLVCLIGAGPARTAVDRQIARTGLTGNMILPGTLAPESLADWYRAADLTVLTSDSEGLPNVLRESLACGTPFVSTDVGSVRELAAPPWGRFVPPGDPQALVAAIDETLSQPLADPLTGPPTRTWRQRASEIAGILRSCGAGETSSHEAQRQGVAVCS